jgi:catechol 2,3-dioxygenase-like lactoylglutathione lyase family enzyme
VRIVPFRRITLAIMPESHAGRLLDHVHLRVADLERSKRFYRSVLQAVGRDITAEGDDWFSSDELFVSADGTPTSGFHFAVQAADTDAVERFHEAGLIAGGRDNGRAGERNYHPGYFSAYVLDPDGNNVEAVYHGEVDRSAPSVRLRW